MRARAAGVDVGRRLLAALGAAAVAAAALASAEPAAAQGASELCDASGVEQFSDVADGDYGAAYILCAKALRLTTGRSTGIFDPDAKLSRAQMAAFLARLWRDSLGQTCPSEPAHSFRDIASSFAEADIACLYALGITKGTTATTYSPAADLKTTQVTRFVARLLNKAKSGTCDLSGDELRKAAACLTWLNIAPSTAEAASTAKTPRAQMAVYLIGAWHHAANRGQPPNPPALNQPSQPVGPLQPATTTRLEAVSAGTDHTCVITANDRVQCWGSNGSGEADPPDGTFKAVSAGSNYTCAITTNDQAKCWGNNEHGQTDAPGGAFKAVSAGSGGQACAITVDNKVKCWGSNEHGQANAPNGSFKSISAGGGYSCGMTADFIIFCDSFGHTCGITVDNKATCWGNNEHGQTDAPNGAFKAISAGHSHTCGITADDKIKCWGNNEYGQATAPNGNFKTISAGGGNTCFITRDGTQCPAVAHTCAITTDNQSKCWGHDAAGQIAASDGVTAISAGRGHTCAIALSGRVKCWGDNSHAQAVVPGDTYKSVSVATGGSHACAITTDNRVKCWGNNAWAQAVAPSGAFKMVSAGGGHTCAITINDKAKCWGANGHGQADAPNGTFKSISAGFEHTCAIAADDKAKCWGADRDLPPAPAGAFKKISAGSLYACAITVDDKIQCWGNPLFGDYGQMDAPNGAFKDISGTCAITVDNKIQCWGDDQADVPNGDFKDISGTCAITVDNKIQCWEVGDLDYGQAVAPSGLFKAVSTGTSGYTPCAITIDNRMKCWGRILVPPSL